MFGDLHNKGYNNYVVYVVVVVLIILYFTGGWMSGAK